MSSIWICVNASCIAVFLNLTVISEPNAAAYASENAEDVDFLFAVGNRIIEESCRSDSPYSQCLGQSGIKCEKGMRLGLEQCVVQLIDDVPNLDVDPKSLGTDNQTPFHKLGENMGLCLVEQHLDSTGIDKEKANECLNKND